MQNLPRNMLLKCLSLVFVNLPLYFVLCTILIWPVFALNYALFDTLNYFVNFGTCFLLSAEYYILLKRGLKELKYIDNIKSGIKYGLFGLYFSVLIIITLGTIFGYFRLKSLVVNENVNYQMLEIFIKSLLDLITFPFLIL